jgi:hypothetical protein
MSLMATSREVTVAEKADPAFSAMPRYWVPRGAVDSKLGKQQTDWLHGYRWISNATNERTLIVSRFPRAGAGNSLPVISGVECLDLLLSCMSSYVCDFCLRQKLGGQNVTFGTVSQLPILHPDSFSRDVSWLSGRLLDDWISHRVDRLFLRGLPPGTRELLITELDALFFHLYGIDRDDVDYIMETFPIVKRKDIAAQGEYRTKRMILEIYDAMAEAIRTGVPYESN